MRAPATRRPALASASLVGAATQVCAPPKIADMYFGERVRPQHVPHSYSTLFPRPSCSCRCVRPTMANSYCRIILCSLIE